MDSALQGLLVSVEGGAERFCPFTLLSSLDLLELQLLEPLIDLLLLGCGLLNTKLILLLAPEFNLLEVLQRRGQLSQVGAQLPVLLRQLVNLLPKQVHLVDCSPVAIGDI